MKYNTIAEHYHNCFVKYGDNNLGVDWPNYEDAQTRYRVMYDLITFDQQQNNFSKKILDFGCGLGHFYDWLQANNKFVDYSGLDINESFYSHCKNKFPNLNFYHKDILVDNDLPEFDYIVCNGTFTEKLDLNQNEMFDFFSKAITNLWFNCKRGLVFNVMSKQVDWERDDLFHVSMDELAWFLKNNLSRNFIIRNDYKLYEYSVYVYK